MLGEAGLRMSQVEYLTEIAHNLHKSLDALDLLGFPAAAAFVAMAITQVELERSRATPFASNLAPFGDPRFATLDALASEVR